MMPFFIFRLIMVIVIIALLTGSILVIMKYYFSYKKPKITPQDITENKKIFLPLRLQAHERIILYLERISPPSLIQRVSRPEMSSTQLQAAMTKVVREEFEYNLSQQIYISAKAWELVKNAKEETIKLIHTAAGKTSEGNSSHELIKIIFDESVANEKHPVDYAITEVKKSVDELMS